MTKYLRKLFCTCNCELLNKFALPTVLKGLKETSCRKNHSAQDSENKMERVNNSIVSIRRRRHTYFLNLKNGFKIEYENKSEKDHLLLTALASHITC